MDLTIHPGTPLASNNYLFLVHYRTSTSMIQEKPKHIIIIKVFVRTLHVISQMQYSYCTDGTYDTVHTVSNKKNLKQFKRIIYYLLSNNEFIYLIHLLGLYFC